MEKEIQAIQESVHLLQAEAESLRKKTPVPIEKIVVFLKAIAEIKAKGEKMGESDTNQLRAVLPYMDIVKKYVATMQSIVQKEVEVFKKEEESKEIAEAVKKSKEGIEAHIRKISGETRVQPIRFEKSREIALEYPKFL